MASEKELEALRKQQRAYQELFGSPTELEAALDDAGCETLVDFVDKHASDLGAPQEVRDAVIEIHQDWIDVREGRTDQFDTRANRRRAAYLFQRFLQRLGGPGETGVRKDNDRYKMSGERAAGVIRKEDVMPSGVSKTVRRTFRELVRGGNPYQCNCNWQDCNHGLFSYKKNDGGYQISVTVEAFHEYADSVVETIQGLDTVPATDDGGNSPEDAVADEWDQLAAAEVKADD